MARPKIKTFDSERDVIKRPPAVTLTVRFPDYRRAALNHFLADHIYLASLTTVINHMIVTALDDGAARIVSPEPGDAGMNADSSESISVRFPPDVFAKIEGLSLMNPQVSRTQIINQLVEAGLNRFGY